MAEVPKIVVQRLQSTAKAEAHPDSDLINAFIEESLDPRDRDRLLEHLTQCVDCREIAALSLPELDAATTVVKAGSGWRRWPVLRWSAVAACAVIVGTAVTLHYQSRSDRQVARLSDAAVTSSVEQKKEPSPAPPTSIDQQGPAGTPAGIAGRTEKSANRNAMAALPAPAAPAAEMAAPASVTAGAVDAMQERRAKSALKTSNETVEMADENGLMVPGRAKDALQQSPASPTGAAVAGGMLAKQRVALAAPAAASAFVPSAYVPRWTLSSDGTLQRSIDSGRSWQTISTPGQGNFRALAASGPEIWVGGAKGALYHSSDAGAHWVQVQPVAGGQALTADIASIEFTDPQHGTLTTNGHETWVTADAGQTWEKK